MSKQNLSDLATALVPAAVLVAHDLGRSDHDISSWLAVAVAIAAVFGVKIATGKSSS